MNILGIGGPELIVVLLIMLIVAGPKRMIHWSYVLGVYVSKFRRMWAETVDVIQKEFDEAGVDVKLPRDMPTRGSLNREITKAIGSATSGLTAPVKETLDQVNEELSEIHAQTKETAQATTETLKGNNGHKISVKPKTQPAAPGPLSGKPAAPPATTAKPVVGNDGFGAWSAHTETPDVGVWSDTQTDGE